MVFAPPRHGKCIAAGERVMLANGSLKRIEDIHPSDMVITLNSCYNTDVSKTQSVYENGVKPVIKITLVSGKTLICTENHPLLTVHGWVETGELKIGDAIATVRQLPIPEGEPLPYGFSALMGYLTGDGSFGKGEPIITATDDGVIADLNDIATHHGWVLKLHGKCSYHIRRTNRKGNAKDSAQARLRQYINPARSADKRVPGCIFSAGYRDVCRFLAAYFNCDATVNSRREGVVEFYSVSKGLLEDVQLLLTRLGIYSTLRVKNGRYKGERHLSYRLIISGHDVVLLAHHLPAVGKRGGQLFELAETLQGKSHYPEYDAIPDGWQDYTKHSSHWHRYNTGVRVDKKYKYGTARHIVRKIAEVEQNEYLFKLCSPDINWERIVNIELVGEMPTFDLTIDNTHNFCVNGVIVHNSQLLSRQLPAYYLGRNPNGRIIAGSYNSDLAALFNRDVQRIIDSPEYGKIFPATSLYGKNVRSDAKGMYIRNSDAFEIVGHGGSYRGAGVGVGITGRGYDLGIVDDPIKDAKEANSITYRNNLEEWYQATFLTRQQKNSAIVLTLTRWHEDDLAGRILALAKNNADADQWVVLNLPAIAEQPIPDYDPRQIDGPLWLDEFDSAFLRSQRASVGTYFWNALYQQRPKAPEGNRIKRVWLPIVPIAPAEARKAKRTRYWDKGGTQDGGAYTAGVLLFEWDGITYIEDVVRGQWSAGEREATIKQTAELDAQRYGKTNVSIYIEQEPGSGGKESAEATIKNLKGFKIYKDRPSGDKDTRIDPFAVQAEAGNVRLIEGAWNYAYIEEMVAIPNSKYRDQGDATSGAFNKHQESNAVSRRVGYGGMSRRG